MQSTHTTSESNNGMVYSYRSPVANLLYDEIFRVGHRYANGTEHFSLWPMNFETYDIAKGWIIEYMEMQPPETEIQWVIVKDTRLQ